LIYELLSYFILHLPVYQVCFKLIENVNDNELNIAIFVSNGKLIQWLSPYLESEIGENIAVEFAFNNAERH